VVGNQPADSIVVYATSAGTTAADGTGRNGLFTTHLLNNLKTPGLEISEVFRRTGADVSRASGRKQIPAVYNQFFGTAYLGRATPQPAPTVTLQREGLVPSALKSEERQNPVAVGGSYRYILTRDQVLNTYETARDLFNKDHDESAKMNLNRILESNASDAVKGKARLLISYMEVPGFDTLRDRFAYTEVQQEPALYRDCHVVWRGMATNLMVGETTTSFDFLVGYDTRSTLLGIVPVKFAFSVSVNPEQPLEVLGRVVLVSTDKGLYIVIEGVALHQTVLPFSNSGGAK
jgi:hypothetical protein